MADLVSTNEVLGTELGGVLARLETTNRALQQVSTDASSNLGAIEDGLAGRVHQLQTLMSDVTTETGRATEQLGAQVDTLRGISAGALREIASLAGSLGESGRELAETSRTSLAALSGATTELARAEDRIGQVLDERRSAVAALLEEVDSRSAAVTNGTRSLASLITRTLGEAEARTRELGAALAATAESTTGAVGEHLDQVRAETAADGERIAAALRASFEQITSEMNGRLETALTQFRETAGELRSMSGSIRSELDRTREELKHGLAGLPRETEETTAEMRRVVADQIKALNELSQMVTRSPRAADVVPAAMAGGSRRGEASAVIEAPPTELAERRTSGRKADAPEELARPARERSRRSDDTRPSLAPVPVESKRPAEAAPEEGESLTSLDTIARDVARLIDGPRGIEMWERHRRGERGAFTRRLYTAQGLGTFEEVRRKYTGDASFKRTVDHYVGEFEKLIDGVGQGGRGQERIRSYLASETGKVYLILAHASGRFS
jgi:phage-related tail protein